MIVLTLLLAAQTPRFTVAYANWSPDGKSLVFQANPHGNYDIYESGKDGKGLKKLVGSAGNDITPIYSPDGKKIIFVSERDGNREVYVCNRDGSGQKNLTNHSSIDLHPIWSPDGKRLMFSSNRNADHPADFDIFAMNADGSGLTQFTDGPEVDTYASWSPDMKQVVTRRVIQRDNGSWANSEVFMLDADGKNPRNLTNLPTYEGWPMWSPDGQWVAYGSGPDNNTPLYIGLMKPDGSGKRPLSLNPSDAFTYHTQPCFSPNGKELVFTRYFTQPGMGEFTELCIVGTAPGQAGKYRAVVGQNTVMPQ